MEEEEEKGGGLTKHCRLVKANALRNMWGK